MPDIAETPPQSARSRADTVINVENVSKLFQTPTQENLDALLNIDLDIRHGEFVTKHRRRPQRLRQIHFAQANRRIFAGLRWSYSLPRR